MSCRKNAEEPSWAAETAVSVLPSIDSLVRISSLFLLSCVIAVLQTWQSSSAALVVACSCCFFGWPGKKILKRLAAINAITLCIWVTMPFTFGETPFSSFGGLTLYWEGIERSLVITLKMNAVLLLCMCLLQGSSVYDVARVMRVYRLPDKLVVLLVFTWQHMQCLLRSYMSVRRAAALRGFRLRMRWHALRSAGALVSSVLIKSVIRSEKVTEAMRLRGFSGSFHASLLAEESSSGWWFFYLSCGTGLFLAGIEIYMRFVMH